MKNEKLKKLRELFTNYEIGTWQKASAYLNGIGLNYNRDWTNKQQELFHIDRFNYIHKKSVDEGLTPIFITLTLPSEYHQFKKGKDGNHVDNPAYDSSNTISKGYKELLRVFRILYGKYRTDGSERSLKKLKFSRVVEPHKDYTPHLHAVIYVEDAEHYRAYFDGVVDRAGLKQVDFEVLGKGSHSVQYLLKYVSKSIAGDDSRIAGWSKMNKIVMVRTSNMPFTKVEYVAFKSNVAFDSKYHNYYFQMEDQLCVDRYLLRDESATLLHDSTKEDLFYKRVDDFRKVTVGNSVNPMYKMETWDLLVKRTDELEKTVAIEFWDSPYYVETETQVCYDNYGDAFEIPSLVDYDLCEDEIYNGCPIPVTTHNIIWEDDDNEYVEYRSYNVKSMWSKIKIHHEFKSLGYIGHYLRSDSEEYIRGREQAYEQNTSLVNAYNQELLESCPE